MITRKSALITLGTLLLTFGNGFGQNDSLPPPAPTDTVKPSEILEMSEDPGTRDNVKRANFATAVVDREPTDEVDSLGTSHDKVYFFTEIVGYAGGSITHRWVHDGEQMAEVKFDIDGPRWRVYSSKNLIPTQTGQWTVEVLDRQGNVLDEKTFTYYVEETAVDTEEAPVDTLSQRG